MILASGLAPPVPRGSELIRHRRDVFRWKVRPGSLSRPSRQTLGTPWLDEFSEGTHPTSIRSGIRRACRVLAGQLFDGPGQLQSDRPEQVGCKLATLQCCPRQALRATPRCLTPRVESRPAVGRGGAACRNRTADLLITRRKLTVTSAVIRRDLLQRVCLRCPRFSYMSGSSLHEWLHAASAAWPASQRAIRNQCIPGRGRALLDPDVTSSCRLPRSAWLDDMRSIGGQGLNVGGRFVGPPRLPAVGIRRCPPS